MSAETKLPIVSVTFVKPVPPGNTVTIGLRLSLGPRIGGVHLLGLTAFAQGQKAHPYFLGFSRIRFDDN